MKLTDEKKRFQFIKNGQVTIDNNLDKYQKIKVVKEDKKINEGPSLTNMLVPVDPDGSPRSVDKKLRDFVMEIKETGFGQYLMNNDAIKFNAMFKDILNAEVDVNQYSIAVSSNRWVANVVYDDVKESDGGSPSTASMTIGDRIRSFFAKKNTEKKKEHKTDNTPSEPQITVLDLFDLVHVEAGKEKEFADRVAAHFGLMERAIKMGQVAQFDELCQSLIIHIYESILAGHGMCRYITFDDITQLQGKCDRVLDIDYISTFGRVIPEDVVNKKIEMDKLCIFDNYCVLYYDPTEKMHKESSKKEAAAKRDPILFGLINHSEKLYYIADWVDDLCDLTLNEVINKIGEDKVKEIPLEEVK